MQTYSSKKLLIILFCFGALLQAKAQCEYLNPSTLQQLAQRSYAKKIETLHEKNATQLIEKNEKPDCEATTFVSCKNFINDKQWHWDEIISFNSCDKILTYSTSNKKHFKKIKVGLTRNFTSTGYRNYSGLDFELFEDKNGQAIEINEHPNEEGIVFYLINICLLYTSPSPRDLSTSRMPSSA